MSDSPPCGGGMIRMTLPMPPSSVNVASGASRNFWVIAAMRKQYFKMLDERQNNGLIPPPPKVALKHVDIRTAMHVGRRNDDDNAMIRAYKWPCDWLKTRGYIVDDAGPYCRMFPPEQIVKRDGNYRIELSIDIRTAEAA